MLIQKGLAVESPDEKLNHLALEFLRNGAKMPLDEMEGKLQAWHDSPSTLISIDPQGAREQMLADFSRGRGSSVDMTLAEDNSLLCQKKDIIIEKFDQLLKKLGGEELAANITMGKVTEEWKKAMEAWMDSESTYRLTVEKAKEATEGASFARSEYEKWSTAWKTATKELELMKKQHGEERTSLALERELIKEIMRLIGVLHDVPVSEQSKAAGGVESTKDATTGVSDPYASTMAQTKAELEAKIKRLDAVNAKLKIPGSAQKLAQMQQLPVYSETEEVVKILKDLLKEIDDRENILDDVEKKAQGEVDSTYAKLLEWEKKLVVLSDAADKAKEQSAAAQLTRSKLAGQKTVADATKKDEQAAYDLVIPPYQREIYVIVMIKKKINDHCASKDGAATA